MISEQDNSKYYSSSDKSSGGGDANYISGGAYRSSANYSPYVDGRSSVSQPEGQVVDLVFWAKLFLHYWYLFLAAIVLALALGFVKNRSWMPLFKSEARIIVGSSQNYNPAYSFMQGFGDMGYTQINNQLLILGSYDIIDRAIGRLPLGVDYYTKGHFRTASLYGNEPIKIIPRYIADEAYEYEFHFFPIDDTSFEIQLEEEAVRELYPNFRIKGTYGEPVETPLFFATIEKMYIPANNAGFLFRFRNLESLENEFANRLELSYIGEESTVLSVALTGNVVPRDCDFLDALCVEYLNANLEEKNEEAKRTIDFINAQLHFIADSLHTSEARLQKFRRENNMVDVNGYTSSVLAKLNSLDQQRAAINLKDSYFEELSKYLRSTMNTEKLVAPSTIGVSDPMLLDLVSKYNALQQKRSEVGEKNPNYHLYSKRLGEVRETLIEVLSNVRRIHDLERGAFEQEYNQVMGDLRDLPQQELTMLNYERSYKVNDNYYTFLLQKQSEALIRRASNVPDNKILQHARTGSFPVNANKRTVTYLIFLVFGCVVVAAFIVLRELLNNVVRDVNDIRSVTKFGLIGEIRHTNDKDIVVSTKRAKSIYAEGYRRLRSRIEFITMRKDNISLLVSSAMSGDGKSHFVANFAGIYGMLGKKTILLDVDMRNPILSHNMGCDNAKGLTNILIGEKSFEEVVVRGKHGVNYDFLPLGVVPPNPSELMNSEPMKTLLEKLKAEYDFIIIDTSPLGLVADAYALVGSVDINLMICRAYKTRKAAFRSLTDQLLADNVKNVYLVLNDVPDPKTRFGGKYVGKAYSYYGEAGDKSKYYTKE